jgi:hypothetical protein
MRVLEARNVHEALPKALSMIQREGVLRDSRNGRVLMHPHPVTTVYYEPTERVLFWPERDANPAFHLYEALWMLRGRNDLAPLQRYVKDFGRFSDDGQTLYGAYGFRWRKAHDDDQLEVISRRLMENPDDRRCILSMWDTDYDLDRDTRDLPCNVTVNFQINTAGALDMTVFNRSNDIVLGAYGANAVHFSVLQEYMAIWIGVPVGVYRQVSCNWHAYQNEQYRKVSGLSSHVNGHGFAQPANIQNPYRDTGIRSIPMMERRHGETTTDTIKRLDSHIEELLMHADTGFELPRLSSDDEPWVEVAYAVLRAHDLWRKTNGEDKYRLGFAALQRASYDSDWIAAMQEWLMRRHAACLAKQRMASGEVEAV